MWKQSGEITRANTIRRNAQLAKTVGDAVLRKRFEALAPDTLLQLTRAVQGRVPGGAVSDVMVDRRRMDQVLSNLVENALRHTPAGGRVTVGLSEGVDEVSFTVSDNGEGIDAEDLSRIFMRFYRVGEGREGKPGGSGLGLAISKALVEAQGGRLSAASDGPGQGAEFTVRIPRK